MHPAFSVIIFTTVSGAGYGLAIWLGIAAIAAPDVFNSKIVAAMLGLAMAFMGVGLMASAFHLGHPERAWRALSQWRTSWLSREAICALLTFLPLGVVFMELVLGIAHTSWLLPAGGALSIVCLLYTSDAADD